MNFLNKAASALGSIVHSYRSSLENPSVPLSAANITSFLEGLLSSPTDSGARVSSLTALQVSTVYACVDLISGVLAAIPKRIFEQQHDAKFKRPVKSLAIDHPVYELIHETPNPEMTSFTLFKVAQVHALLWTNAYIEIQRDNGNRIVALWPVNPAQTRPYRDTPTSPLYYKTSQGMEGGNIPNVAGERNIRAEDMVHVPGLSLDGRLGQDTIQLSRQIIGMALATDAFAARFFGNGAQVSLQLEHPGRLSKEAAENLRRSIQEAQSGAKQHRLLVTEEGIKVNKIGTEPNEAQMLETRQHNRREICALFHVPPHMIGDMEQTNRATAEQIGVEFVNYTLGPWIAAWQQELRRKLLPAPRSGPNAAKRHTVLFDTWKLTFPDGESRSKFYAGGIQWGYFCPNDVLAMEDKNPIEGELGEQYFRPVNMVPAEKWPLEAKSSPKPEDPNEPEPEDEPEDEDEGKKEEKALPAASPDPPFYTVFRDAIGRASVRKKDDARGFERCLMPVLTSLGEWSGAGEVWAKVHLAEIYGRAAEWNNTAEDIALIEWPLACKSAEAYASVLKRTNQ